MALVGGKDIFDEIKEDFFARSFEAFRVQAMDRQGMKYYGVEE